ncbi:MAG: glycosyltransferase [Clostridia bacterium]|nr:glycosyltransferase [Clostridia bacterium]
MTYLPRVVVLLSAYNGEKYIAQQLESLFGQECSAQIDIIVRDDGSSDNTVSIVQSLMQEHPNLHLTEGKNMGLVGSFFELLKDAVEQGYDYYSFCDQDDYWQSDKMQTAIDALSAFKEPAMYASCSLLADESLAPMGRTTQTQKHPITFYNSAIQNFCPGHNQVLNHQMALNAVNHTRVSHEIYSHDLWITNIAATSGKIIFDNAPHALYRQHTNNQLSYGKTKLGWIKNHLKRLKSDESRKMAVQLRYFGETCRSLLNDEQQRELKGFFESQSSFFARLKYISRTGFYRQKRVETFLFKIMYLIKLYNV